MLLKGDVSKTEEAQSALVHARICCSASQAYEAPVVQQCLGTMCPADSILGVASPKSLRDSHDQSHREENLRHQMGTEFSEQTCACSRNWAKHFAYVAHLILIATNNLLRVKSR